jgi:hypothetical protein
MDELEKIYQDFINKRITAIRPDYSASILSGGVSSGIEPSLDFTSLYPGVQKRYYKLKVMIRKKKIQRMFQNPS